MPETAVDFKEAEQMLLTAEFQDCRPLWYSSNYVFLAQLCGPGGSQFAAVYKPLRGESPLWDFPDGGLYRREVAAYELSKLLGWAFIPPTVAREGPEGVGSLQIFIQHDTQSHFFSQRERDDLVPQLRRICAFDYVANNADRKGGHCLLDLQDHVWGIDHGLCFHSQYKLRSVIWDWAGDELPDEWLADVEQARSDIEAEEPSTAVLRSLLSPHELSALCGRMHRLLEEPVFPHPGPHRSYPWPLV